MSKFNNPVDVAVALIPVVRPDDVAFAGIIRGKQGDAGFGKLALPGGFVNAGESIETAVAREVLEELGFESAPRDWALMHSRHLSQANINLVFCAYQRILRTDILADAKPNVEVSGFAYIIDTTELAFSLHMEAVRLYYERFGRDS